MAAGTSFTSGTLQTTWAAYTAANRAVGQFNLAATNGNYLRVTAVQLEVGTVPTEFERRPYAVEFDICQRYLQKLGGQTYTTWGFGTAYDTSSVRAFVPLAMKMRVIPAISYTSGVNMRLFDGANGHASLSVVSIATIESREDYLAVTVTNGFATLTQFRPYYWQSNNDATNFLLATAEL